MRLEVWIYLSLLVRLLSSLRITKFEVPSFLVPGDSAYLTCLYDLGKEKLYSIKWYKDNVEFYRFFPSLSPQYMAFPASGITVDLSKSGPSTVYLRNVSLDTEGRYTCQVSADEPYFGCVQVHREVTVYVPPQESPSISGGITEEGENLTIRCSSAKSKPAANLSWYVNDILMMPDDPTSSYEIVRHPDKLETASSALNIPMASGRLPDGNIRLTCAASISNLVTSISKELLISRQDGLPDNDAKESSKNIGIVPQSSVLLILVTFMICTS